MIRRKNKLIKIAHCMSSLSGGVGKMIMNYFDNMENNDYEIHVITQDIASKEYLAMYEKRGYIIHVVPSKKEGLMKNFIELKNIMKKEKFDIVHAHMTVTNLFPLMAAKYAGTNIRISHSHLAEKWNIVEKSVALLTKLVATDYIACGEEAGIALFGKSRFLILHNAINVEKFKFNQDIRNEQRNILKIDNEKILCHVGRFTEQKDHMFLIEIFKMCLEKNENIKLLLIGEGELEKNIKAIVREEKLENKVIFLGMIDDVENKLQIADVFLLPSKFEGLSIAAIEAQASGLPCIISTNVDVKTKINKNVRLIDKNNKQKWVDEIFNALKEQRYCSQDEIIAAGYDIKTEAIKLDKLYKNKIIKLRNSR